MDQTAEKDVRTSCLVLSSRSICNNDNNLTLAAVILFCKQEVGSPASSLPAGKVLHVA